MSGGEPRASALQALLAEALLRAGARLDLWSLALTLPAAVAPLLVPLSPLARAALLATLVAGGVQRYFALRVDFDRRVFEHWAKSWDSASTPEQDMGEFDRAMAADGLRATPDTTPRPLGARIRGARALLHRQVFALSAQFAGWVAAAIASGLDGG